MIKIRDGFPIEPFGNDKQMNCCCFFYSASAWPASSAIRNFLHMLPSSSLEIGDRRMGAQVLQEPEAPRAAGKPRDAALRVRNIAEDERLGRTGLSAGGLNLPVFDQPSFGL